MKFFLIRTIAFMLPSIAVAQEIPHAVVGALIYPVEGKKIENGVLVFESGKVTAIGSRESVVIPSDAAIIDATGKVMVPGFVDTHSHIGGGSGGDRSAAMHPDVRILDAIDIRSSSFKKALAGGITTVNIMPGSGHLMSGQTAYLKLRDARTIEEMLFCKGATSGICGGMKMANGTNSIGEKPFPGTRAKSAALARQLYVRAQEYKAKIEAAEGDPEKMPKRDLDMEALVEVLEGKRIVHHHTHRADDILTVLRLKEEFGFRLVLHHVSEGWKVAEEIARAKVPCSIITLDSP
ncbi:MAG TPA: amidohydrolase, partial [Bacteroidota bacterium]